MSHIDGGKIPGSSDVSGPGSSTDNALARWDGAAGDTIQNSTVILDDSGNLTGVTSITIGTAGLKLFDTNASHTLAFVVGSNLTANRTLTITTGDASRALTINGDATLNDWFDQSVKQAASPTFAGLTLSSPLTVGNGGTGVTSSTGTGSVVLNTSPGFTTAANPSSSDGASLGTTALMWSDLFLASGAVINFDNGDVTLTHSANAVTLAGGGFRTTAAGIGVNKANSASIALEVKADSTFTQGIRVEADADTRLGFSSFVTGDAQVRFTFRADGLLGWGDGTNTTDTNLYRSAANTLKTDDALIVTGALTPAANDGAALGSATVSWADLFLASGGVINFNNGDVTITHAANLLTFAGGTIEFGATVRPTSDDGAALGSSSFGWSDLYLASGGNILAAGANAKRTLILTAAGGSPTTTIGCGGPTKVEAGTNDIDYWALEFDTSSEERAFWNVLMPDNYDGGTVTAKFIWTNAGGASTETVRWGIKARAYADDAAIDQAYGSEVTVDDTWLAQGDVHVSAASGAITIGGSPAGGQWVVFNVGRKVANDNMAGDARLLAVQIEYGINAYSD